MKTIVICNMSTKGTTETLDLYLKYEIHADNTYQFSQQSTTEILYHQLREVPLINLYTCI